MKLLPHWRFKDPLIAEKSSAILYEKFEEYKIQGDFVGMDMARKYIQMGLYVITDVTNLALARGDTLITYPGGNIRLGLRQKRIQSLGREKWYCRGQIQRMQKRC